MAEEPKYQRYLVNGRCVPACTLSASRLGKEEATLVLRDIEEGRSMRDVAARHNERDPSAPISHGAVRRHKVNHLTKHDESDTDDDLGGLTELEALDMAIKQGQKSIPNWKMTPSEWMKAMELKLRLTEGTVHDAMNQAIAQASKEDEDDDAGTPRPAVRPGGVEKAGAEVEPVLSLLPEGRAASGADGVAGQLDGRYQYVGSGEPVGEDVRHRDEAHPQERVQGGPAADDEPRVAGSALSDG